MSKGVPFAQTARALDRGLGLASGLIIALVVGLFAIGVAWSLLTEVALYEASERGRIEAHDAAHRVESASDGRVREVMVALGDHVVVGQPLAALDDGAHRLEIAALRARVEAIDGQLGPLREAVEIERQAVELDEKRAGSMSAELLAERRAALARARLAEDEAQRAAALRARGVVPEAEHDRAHGRAAVSRAEADGTRHSLRTQKWHVALQHLDRASRLQALRERLASLRGQRAALIADIAVVEHALLQLTVRAPVAGRVASLSGLTPGTQVEAGTSLMSIVPEQELHAVAFFAPAAAVGRVRPGQRATLRLRGFPWLQYGTVDATVEQVAGEPSDDGIRVTFALQLDDRAVLPAEHGLEVDVEVEVERVAPAAIVLRAAGQWLSGADS